MLVIRIPTLPQSGQGSREGAEAGMKAGSFVLIT